MSFGRSLLAPLILVGLLLGASGSASAQQACDTIWGSAEICELSDQPQQIDLDWRNVEQGNISFRVVSRQCTRWIWIFCTRWQGVSYTLGVTGPVSTGSAFRLDGINGSVPINLTYSSTTASDLPLLPGAPTSPVQGTTGHENAYITVWLTGPNAGAPLLAGTYTGTFDLTLQQQSNCGSNGCQVDSVTFAIQLNVPANIRISGLNDMTINAPAEMTKSEDFCVFTQGGAAFGIKADSAAGNGSFQFQGQNTGDRITYNAEADTHPPSAPVTLNEGVPTPAIWSGHIQQDCNNGSNMRIVISLPTGALDNAEESTYTDTLTLTVELE
ncbi:hypothetical protein [Microbulbifer magnicolonia]|uniref:hypothetical protein n=1 Tax=Microbulbifer magnicolonia TaxID=3109744 RepID=UPI002B415F0A|nr:hypothetical protein [Microbulbifer sp. GG15]